MKTLLTFLAVLIAVDFSYAQTTVTSDANGVLNIPRIVTQTSYGQIFYTGHQLGSSYANPVGIYRAWTDNPNGAQNYFYDGITGSTTTFSIRADGQGYFANGVGIGIASPMAKLQIGSGTTNSGSSIAMFSDASTGGRVNALSLVNSAPAATGNEATMTFHTAGYYTPTAQIGAIAEANQPSTDLTFSTYNLNGISEKLRILGNGNVGIGTTTPKASLDINGGLFVGANNLDGANLSYLSNSSKMLIGWNRSSGSGETDFISNQGPGGPGGFAYYNYSNSGAQSLLMYLRGNGQMTIGDCNPYSYKLAVGGSMIAESVTVKLYANWPDYVFKPTYQLKPLSEVKAYIAQNQHLPEMPSAAEVEKEGVNLGEMNKLLVKKVEELTLYLIEQNRKLEDNKQENTILKRQVEALAKEIHKN